MRGTHGEKLHLSRIEDRAWLGALIVGEGSIFTRTSKLKATSEPCLAIAMQDRDALEKAATLMGVRVLAAGRSKASGRRFWRVVAVGSRAIQIFKLVKPFLTPTKRTQAEEAIKAARSTGFVTKVEMKDRRKSLALEGVRAMPGSFTRDLARKLGISHSYALKYLRELAKESKVREINVGTAKRARRRWFATDYGFLLNREDNGQRFSNGHPSPRI